MAFKNAGESGFQLICKDNMRVGISINKNAYTPEAYAYKTFLLENGVDVNFVENNEFDSNNDLNILFMGLQFSWSKCHCIHEYQSLSTPPYSLMKNFIKKTFNKIPDGRIFLNEFVKNEFNFEDSTEYIYRDMGVDKSFFNIDLNKKKYYDFVYCGSINGRAGLIENIFNIARKGFKIILVGDVPDDVFYLFKDCPQIEMTGKLSRNEIVSVYERAYAGLNYVPDSYPFNLQTSTKLLEYLAAGLFVYTNNSKWSVRFLQQNNVKFDLIDNLDANAFQAGKIRYEFIYNYSWECILKKAKFIEFITNCARK